VILADAPEFTPAVVKTRKVRLDGVVVDPLGAFSHPVREPVESTE
jgi:hypothetical protein